MSSHLHPIVLEARFGQWALALQAGPAVSGAMLAAVGRQARAALREVDALVIDDDTAQLGRSAARLARAMLRLGPLPGGAPAIEQRIVRLGIEMGRPFDPLSVAAVVRSVRHGNAQLPTPDMSIDKTAADQATLFTQIALVAALALLLAPAARS